MGAPSLLVVATLPLELPLEILLEILFEIHHHPSLHHHHHLPYFLQLLFSLLLSPMIVEYILPTHRIWLMPCGGVDGGDAVVDDRRLRPIAPVFS